MKLLLANIPPLLFNSGILLLSYITFGKYGLGFALIGCGLLLGWARKK